MNRFILRAFGVLALSTVWSASFAQGTWGVVCIDPANTTPRSTPYAFNTVFNDLMVGSIGLTGTVTYGGTSGPCFAPAQAVDIVGRFSIGYGPVGSNQRTSANFVDDLMALSFGFPEDPYWSYAGTFVGTAAPVRFGSNGFSDFFVGFSNRYMQATSTHDSLIVRLQVECVADALRFRWRITNTADAAQSVGLLFGMAVGMRLPFGAQSNPESGGAVTSHNATGPGPHKLGYITIPNGRPPVTDKFWDRTADPNGFPSYVAFHFGQSDAAGMIIENSPSAATQDIDANNPSEASRFWLGKDTFMLGLPPAGTFPRAILPDTEFLDGVGFVQELAPRSIPSGQTVQFLHYVRSSWGLSDYKLPFAVAVDAPKTVTVADRDFTGNPTQGGITPNPMPIRVYVDNVGGFAFDGKEFPLNDTRIKVTFPANSGVTMTGADPNARNTRELSIANVPPREIRFVDFSAVVDDTVAGEIPYVVEIFSQPGNVRKTLNGIISVAARTQVRLFPDANFIGLPYQFQDTSLEAIFQPFLDPQVPGGDLQFYRWDPVQQGYVIINTAPRGGGFWAIYNKTGASPVLSQYAGTPSQPQGFLEGAPLIQLRSGFNMIANPYNVRIPINQIVGVSAANPQESRTFTELVNLGLIQSFVSQWNAETRQYELVPAEDGFLEPHRGYWINVLSQDDLTLNYPPVNQAFVANMTRKPVQARYLWPQNDQKWRLRLTARQGEAVDGENYLARVRDSREAQLLQANEAPMSPVQPLSLSLVPTGTIEASRMAQAVTSQTGRQEFKLRVETRQAGDVTITWPNLSTLPKNVRFRLSDPATNTTRQLRQVSGYTFKMDRPGVREMDLVVEEGGTDSVTIGNVVVSQPSRGTNGPVTIAYTLGSEATTSVRILSGTGKEVYTITRGRSDRAGENTVTWNLRNSANQAVAPGIYRVEIVAESASGDRSRRTAVINVIR